MSGTKSKNIAIIGTGYVGLVTAACFAELGNKVTAYDSDEKKIELLQKGKNPIYEPHLEKLISRNQKQKRLVFVKNLAQAIKPSAVIFICVGTPPLKNGEADLSAVEKVGREIAKNLNSYKLIVEKSTVPVQTGLWLEKILKINREKNVNFDVASNPEFLREGSAVKVPFVSTNINSAEIIKHASNSFLSTKISFINALADICEKTGANIKEVAYGVGLDKRIGREFLELAFGFLNLDWQKCVVIDKNFYRPLEVYNLLANPVKARRVLGWKPEVKFKDLVKMMVEADLKALKQKIL